MSLEGLFQLLWSHSAYRSLVEDVKSGSLVSQVELPEAARPYLIAALWHRLRAPTMAIVPRPEDARRLHDQIISYLGEGAPVHLFPEPDVLPFERLVADAAINNKRMEALAALRQARDSIPTESADNGRAPLVVASTPAALIKTIPPAALGQASHSLQVGTKIPLGDLFSRWVDLGYQREEGVEVPGTFGNRGGVVDIYPPSSSLPARIEFLGDQIESIRLFDPVTQRSVSVVDRVTIVPAKEVIPSLSDKDRVSRLIGGMNFTRCTPSVGERFQEELAALFEGQYVDELPLYNGLLNHGCLIDHLPQGGLLVLDREGQVESEALELAERTDALRAAREGRGELPANFPSPHLSWAEFRSALEERPRLLIQGWTGTEVEFDFQAAPSYYGRTPQFAGDVGSMLAGGRRVVVVSRHARRLSEVLDEAGVGAAVLPNLDSPPEPGSLSLLAGAMVEGWTLPLEGGGLTLLTDTELFGTAKERRPRPKTPVKREAFLSELVPGRYLVHIDHGVARFDGTVQMDSSGEQKEYLVLGYAESDKLYVPTDQLDRMSPYLAANDQSPHLTRLGTAEWSRVKERVKNSAREMAQELLELYASRQVIEGHAVSPDSPWQRELEDSFPYEETSDQERTIREVKQDMEQVRPMDRLVCGDVGYGKTEVALRAAFKTVNEGMQVGLMVPTTVLAQQALLYLQ